MPFHYGQATLAAGVAQALTTTVASRVSLKYIVIKALPGNANPLYVGDANVTNLTGYILSANQEIRIDAPGGEFLNTNETYILGTVGEGVSWVGG